MSIESLRPNGTHNLNKNSTELAFNKAAAKQAGSTDEQKSGVTNTDRVLLSDNARHLQAISEKLMHTPDSNQQKVEQIKQALLDGSYQVDSASVASKLLDFEQHF